MMERLDNDLKVAPIYVPADGNCMAWSLNMLFLQKHGGVDFRTKTSRKFMTTTRKIVKEMWVENLNKQTWQRRFMHCFQDFVGQQVLTPQKKKRTQNLAVDLRTPEKPSQSKPTTVSRAASAIPAPLSVREPISPKLKAPGTRKTSALLEPAVPDLEENLSLSLMKAQPSGKHLSGRRAKVTVPQDAAEDAVDDNFDDEDVGSECDVVLDHKFARKAVRGHIRACKKRSLTEVEQKEAKVRSFLKMKGLKYGMWIIAHRRCAKLRKLGVCNVGGFREFQNKLKQGESPEACEACVEWMSMHKFTVQDVQDYLSQPHENHPSEKGSDSEKLEEPVKKKAKSKRSLEAEYEQCVEYINSVPHLSAVLGPILKYRCDLCVTKKQKAGRVNVLGARPKLESVEHFISEHINNFTHQSHLYRLRQEAEAQASTTTECPGYCVSDETFPGILKRYAYEFGLWASHSKLEGRASHSYTQNCNTGTWTVRHHKCTQTKPDDGSKCCRLCAYLGGPKGCQKVVVLFCRAFFSAQLLCKRMFSSEEEVQEFLEQIARTAFGVNNAQSWNKLTELSLPELQQFVRLSLGTVPKHLQTDNMETFMHTVVNPSLKVRVTCIDPSLASLSAHFVQALANRRLSEPFPDSGIEDLRSSS